MDFGTADGLLGTGVAGTVFSTTKGYAVKRVPYCDEEGDLSRTAINELVFPLTCDHPNIIKVYGYRIASDRLNIYMDLYQGNIYDLMDSWGRKSCDWNIFQSIASQLVSAVAYLTSRNIIHRDIKPANVLYRKDKVVLADFGIATGRDSLTDVKEFNVYTLNYRAPEILLGGIQYNAQSEVWALGCTLYEIYAGYYFASHHNIDGTQSDIDYMITEIHHRLGLPTQDNPFTRKWRDKIESLKLVSGATSSLAAHVPWASQPRIVSDSDVNDFLGSMLEIDPNSRSTIFDVQSHSFLDGSSSLLSFESSFQLNLTPRVSANSSPERVELLDRGFDYELVRRWKYFNLLPILFFWIHEVRFDFDHRLEQLIFSVELIYRYISKKIDLKSEDRGVSEEHERWRKSDPIKRTQETKGKPSQKKTRTVREEDKEDTRSVNGEHEHRKDDSDPVTLHEIQLISCASMYITELFLEGSVRPAEHYSRISAKTYTTQEVIAKAQDILSELNYDLCASTPYDRIWSREDLDVEIRSLAVEILATSAVIPVLYTMDDAYEICLHLATADRDDLDSNIWILNLRTYYLMGDDSQKKFLEKNFPRIYQLIC
jgi:serine/threonine protein kinase